MMADAWSWRRRSPEAVQLRCIINYPECTRRSPIGWSLFTAQELSDLAPGVAGGRQRPAVTEGVSERGYGPAERNGGGRGRFM